MIYFAEFYDKDNALIYAIDRLRALSYISPPDIDRLAIECVQAVARGPVRPPLMDSREMPTDAEKYLALSTLAADRLLPVLGNETITSRDSLGALADTFHGYPAGTPALRRVTNEAEMYHFFYGYTVKERRVHLDARYYPRDEAMLAALPESVIVFDDVIAETTSLEPRTSEAGAAIWSALAVFLAQNIASGIVSQIGAAAFTSALSALGIELSGVPGYFDEVYRRFAEILRLAFHEEARRKLNAGINEVQEKFADYHRVGEEWMLQQTWNKLTELLGEFRTLDVGVTPNLSITLGLYLALNQEFMKIAKSPDVKERWRKNLLARTEEFINWLARNQTEILENRLGKITPIFERRNPLIHKLWADEATGHWEAHYMTGYQCIDLPGIQKLRDHRARHIEAVRQETTKELSPIAKIITEWKKLLK